MNTTINVNSVSNEDVDVSEYTIDNPKTVDNYMCFEGEYTFTGVVKDKDGTIAHYANGNIHHDSEPAVIDSYGNKMWRFHNAIHRDNGPAVENADGSKFWYLNSKLHREGGPAVELRSGIKRWCLNGKLHRDNGPAVTYSDGSKEWWFNGGYYGDDDAYTDESWIAHVATLK